MTKQCAAGLSSSMLAIIALQHGFLLSESAALSLPGPLYSHVKSTLLRVSYGMLGVEKDAK